MLLTDSDCPCTKSELQLFEGRPVQTVLEHAQWVDVHPLNNVSSGNAPIEFSINSSPDEYLDLNDMMLYLRCKVVKADGSDVATAEASTAAPVNNWMHSLFSDVKLCFGSTQIEGGVHMYQYKAYLKNLLQFSNASKKEQLLASGFIKDTAGKFSVAATNAGHKTRLASVAGSKSVDLCGPLCLDMAHQGKYLISQVDVNIKLVRSKSEFHLMSSADNDTSRVQIEDAVLYVRRVKVSPGTIMEHEKQLLSQNALYPIQHTQMSTYTIPAGSLSHIRDGLFRGHMPKMVIFGMVDNKAYNGDIKSSPFEFKHNDVCHIALYREGVTVPFRPLTPDFSKDLCVREYVQGLVQGLELYNRDESIGISLNEYSEGGYTLFAFNLTPDLALVGHAQPYIDGNLRLELKFNKALPSSINVVIMAIFDGKVEITRQRQALVDYKG